MNQLDFIKIAARLGSGATISAALADTKVPPCPGYYSIFIDHSGSLPSPFDAVLNARATNLLYIGIANTSLLDRLVEQDLRHRKASTFFRGIGAILGYRPPAGSLINKQNQNNYKFSAVDTRLIVEWINSHLLVTWVKQSPALTLTEALAIRQLTPLLNTVHNPRPSPELAALRSECRGIALTAP